MKYIISELIPDNSYKSFYGKAKVVSFPDGMTVLISYNTVVAYTDADGELHRVWNDWKTKTGQHISAYAKAYTKSGNTVNKSIRNTKRKRGSLSNGSDSGIWASIMMLLSRAEALILTATKRFML